MPDWIKGVWAEVLYQINLGLRKGSWRLTSVRVWIR